MDTDATTAGADVPARIRYRRFVAGHEIAWELAFALLAIIFVAIGIVPPEDAPWVLPLEWVLTGIFAAEFFSRLWAADRRSTYVRGHWIDLVALVPPTRGLRVFRLVRLLRLVRAFAGVARVLGTFERLARHRGLVGLLVAWVAVMLLSSVGLYLAEVGPNPDVTTIWDALWWGITTMTTVGYGDISPVTPEGRIAATVLMLLGIGLFSAVTAILTSFVLAAQGRDEVEADSDVLGQVRRLGDLHRDGMVTDAEFDEARARLLARL